MTDDDEKSGLASDFLAGLISGDFDRMRSVLHDDATWSVPGDTAISGVARGADAVVERAREIHSSDVKIRFVQVLHGLTDVAVELHNTGERGDVRLDEKVFIVFTLSGQRIAAADNLISDVPGLTAFFNAG